MSRMQCVATEIGPLKRRRTRRLVRSLSRSDRRAETAEAAILAWLILVAVTGGGPQRVKAPPRNWFVPPGSNWSSAGGNEAAEASAAEGC
jgi:hypothetical protein